jgi:hypothetical protein
MAPAHAQIAVDATASTFSASNASSLTWSHTVGAGFNRILVVGTSAAGLTSVSSVTYGAAALTRINATSSSSSETTEMWYLLAPPAGTANIVVTFSGSDSVAAGSVSFTGVSQSTPLGTSASASGAGGTPSVTVASATNQVVIDTITDYADKSSLTAGASQTQRWNVTSGAGGKTDVISGGSTKAGAASTTMSWTIGAAKAWSQVAVPLIPAPAFSACGPLGSTASYAVYGSTSMAASGTVSNGTSTNTITGSGSTLNQNTGMEFTPASPPTLPSLSPATFPANGSTTDSSATSFSPGSYRTITISGTTTFAPGIYYINALTVPNGNTVNFGAGTYYIGTLTLNDSDSLVVSSGTVRLNIGTLLSIHDSDLLNAGGTPSAFQIFLYPGADATIHDKLNFAGLLYGPDSGNVISIHNTTTITGAVIGTNVNLGTNDVITYSPAVAASLSSVSTCAIGSVDHYELSLASAGVSCMPVTATVTACNDTSSPCSNASTSLSGQSATLATSAGSLGSTTVTFGATGAASTTLSYPAASNGATATVTLSGETSTAGNARKCCPDGTSCSVANSCSTTFSTAGFIFSASANGAVATLPTQTAGTGSGTYYLRAVKTNTTTKACDAALAGANSVNWAYQCNNPTTCSAGNLISVTGSSTAAITGNPNSGVSSYTSVPMTFDANGNAPFSFTFSDVGQATLWVTKTVNSATLSGTSNAFVTQPAGFTLTNIKRTSDNFANPAASTAGGTVFITAGQAFTATVTAVGSGGATTPNYGRETTPESVGLTATLVLPAVGNAPAVSGAAGTFTNGVATGTAFAWPEVGIVKLVPHVADGNYLGAGDVVGSATGNVGRFVPSSLAVALNTPVFGTTCIAGGYTYLGQPFTYTVAPVITVTALALGGATTQNYTGSLFRLTNTSLTGRTYTPTPASPALDPSGLPAATSDPTIVDLGGGQGTLTFSAGTGIAFARGNAIAPFSANIALSINVIDLDGVAAAGNPVTFGAGSGISFNAGATQRYGRLALHNRVGSELLDLPMSLTTEYYASATLGFTTNTSDSCSAAPALAFSGYQANLSAGETCVRDSGSPGISGVGCAVASGAYRPSALLGDFNLVLAAPGSGNNGAVTVTATAPSWLKYLWNASSGTPSNPSGLAVFGLFPGPASRIYQREVY